MVQNLRPGGVTPMAKALDLAIREIVDNGRILTLSEMISIYPRIILMTDGGVEDEEEVFTIIKRIGDTIPVACVGVTGCDTKLLSKIAKISGGMFTMCTNLTELSIFFLEQILISLFIIEFCKEVQQIFDREVLRRFMREQTGKNCSDEELDQLIVMIKSMAKQKRDERQNNSRPNSQPSANRIQGNTNSQPSANRPSANRPNAGTTSTTRSIKSKPAASAATVSLQRNCSNKIDDASNILRTLKNDINGAESSYQIQQIINRNANNVIKLLNDLQSMGTESQKNKTITDLDDDDDDVVAVQQNKSVSSGKLNSSAKVTELDDSDPPVVDPLESRGSRTTNSKKSLDLNDAEDTKKPQSPARSDKVSNSTQKPVDTKKVIDLDDEDDEPVKVVKPEQKVELKSESKLKTNTAEVKPASKQESKQEPKQESQPQAPMELRDDEELPAINDRIDPVTRRASVAPPGEDNKQNTARIKSQKTTLLKDKQNNDAIELDSSDEENAKNK